MTPCNTGNSAFSESGTDTIASHAGFVNKNGQIKVIFCFLWWQPAEYIIQGKLRIVIETAFEPGDHSRPSFRLHSPDPARHIIPKEPVICKRMLSHAALHPAFPGC